MSSAPLLGIIGPFGPAQLACIRSWRRAGYRTAFFQTGGRRVPAGLQRLTDAYRFYPAGTALDEILDKVAQECVRLQVAGLAALSESLALKLHERQRAGAFGATTLMLNTPELYEVLESKSRQVELARQAGLPVMPTHVLERDSELSGVAGPLVLRPDITRLVRPSFKVKLVATAAEAVAVARAMTTPEGRIVAQPFVAGPNLVIHAARAADGSWDHHEAFCTSIKSAGLAVALQPYALPAGLLDACRRFEQAAGLRGVFHYDFILNPETGEAFFLEVNPRLGGTTAKVYAAGYDEPAMLPAAFFQPGAHRVDLTRPRNASVSRIAAVRYGLSLLREAPSVLDHPPRRNPRAFGQLAKALLLHRDEVFRLTDVVGNSAYLLQTKS
ncbi:hypothetical protein [Massilia sp. DD77]|uniref:hypothetical protein n=1 Tax=Massilia sp. DD77 TaxID=3109349 RepID=UPI002FFE1E80